MEFSHSRMIVFDRDERSGGKQVEIVSPKGAKLSVVIKDRMVTHLNPEIQIPIWRRRNDNKMATTNGKALKVDPGLVDSEAAFKELGIQNIDSSGDILYQVRGNDDERDLIIRLKGDYDLYTLQQKLLNTGWNLNLY